MHAYAGVDPVFLAMNAKGQRETNGELGDFCVRCHAPVALALGLTKDGLNLPELPDDVKGIGCTFCHLIDDVTGSSNNPLVLADDGLMRGGITDAKRNSFHRSQYSPFLDRYESKSAQACGSCHDIVTPNGVHLEQTYAEWKESVYGNGGLASDLTCPTCHMQESMGPAAASGPSRRVHDHSMPGVDLALTDFPHKQEQRALVEQKLSSSLFSEICVYEQGEGVEVFFAIENIASGHSFPSGATQDRRVWAELSATTNKERVEISGQIADDQAVEEAADVWWFGTQMLDEGGQITHDFWKATATTGLLLNAPTTTAANSEVYRRRSVLLPEVPDSVSMSVYLRAIARPALSALILSGDLDPSFQDSQPTLHISGADVSWSLLDHGLGGCAP